MQHTLDVLVKVLVVQESLLFEDDNRMLTLQLNSRKFLDFVIPNIGGRHVFSMTHTVHSDFTKRPKENIRNELVYAYFLKAYIYIRFCILG